VAARVSVLLTTKLHIPPARPDLVSRPRLIEQLNAGLHRKLTLVSAPAGFGKTTLLSEWIHAGVRSREYGVGSKEQTRDRPPTPFFTWVSLDEDDDDPTRFLAYFVAALQTLALRCPPSMSRGQVEGIEPDIGAGALGALQSPQPPPIESVLATLINELAALPDRIILVLDDYHLIEAQPIHDALTFLLEHLPPQVHLVIATREDPHLPLARLRARGQLTELRATDLRFSSSEAAEFLNQVMGLDLSAEDIAALERRTEGWIAGLHLAAISMQGHKDVSGFIRSFTGSHRFVLDYLMEEVLEQQSESVQTFLLQTAILDRLTGSLCDAVRFGVAETPSSSAGTAVRFGEAQSPTGQGNGQATLEALERANLFIVPLDEERRWYRYHHLFADLLRQRLRQDPPPLSSPPLGGIEGGSVAELHLRASEWYEQNGFAGGAIEHALRAEDFERAVHLIEEHVDAIWMRGEHTKLRRWLDWLPVKVVYSKPHLCVFHAWLLFTGGQQDAAERCLQAIDRALDPSNYCATETSPIEEDQPVGSDRMKLRGRVAAIRAFVASYRSDAPEIIQHARQALEYLPEQDLTWRSTATVALGDAYSFVGDLAAAYRVRLEALEASKAAGNIYMILIASVKLAVTMRQQGQLEQVIEINQQQLQLASENGLSQTAVIGWLLATWGVVLADLNDLDGALYQAKKGVELTERGGDVAMLGWSYVCLTRALYSRGDMAGAEEIIQRMENIARESTVPPWITNQMAAWQARIWLAQDKLDAASQWAEKRGLAPDKEPIYVGGVEYGVLARILLAQGRLDETITLLQRMLEPAQAGRHTTRVIENLRIQALAFQAGGDTTRAVAALERALALAEPGGFIRIFVDEGPSMARLLHEALSREIATDYVRRLLAAFPVAEPEQADPLKREAPKSELLEPLSERELEVLQLIAEGLTNPEIASRLFLALNTVKAHSRNIYGKLGVHSRTQAVARARALGILAST
jgi:LuxR family maltose regulon positive regulatory protein